MIYLAVGAGVCVYALIGFFAFALGHAFGARPSPNFGWFCAFWPFTLGWEMVKAGARKIGGSE
jgi:hypothetical protein